MIAAAAWPHHVPALAHPSRETIMVAAVRVHKTGGPEVLTYENIEIGAPGPGQLRVKHHACGINYIDTYFRSGLYPAPSLPFVAGNEGAGGGGAGGRGGKGFKTRRRGPLVRPVGRERARAPAAAPGTGD